MTLRSFVLAALLVTLCGLTGCKTLASVTSGDNPEPTYASDADSNVKLGNESLEAKNYLEAEKYFEYVKTKYPYIEAAKIAELKLADVEFERERFTEARDKYQAFVKLHPTHVQVDYAAYRGALSHLAEFKQNSPEYFFMPDAREKDQVEIRNALRALQDFVRQYPQSRLLPEAKKSVDECRRRLADHEMYVADYYAKRSRWPAVVARLNTVVQDYAGLGFDESALFGLYDAHLALNQKEKAQETLRKVITTLPGTPAATKATRLLGP